MRRERGGGGSRVGVLKDVRGEMNRGKAKGKRGPCITFVSNVIYIYTYSDNYLTLDRKRG